VKQKRASADFFQGRAKFSGGGGSKTYYLPKIHTIFL
jgi:hypothetical protein